MAKVLTAVALVGLVPLLLALLVLVAVCSLVAGFAYTIGWLADRAVHRFTRSRT
ncbi:hypothetical protein [Microcystis phage Mae-JY22]